MSDGQLDLIDAPQKDVAGRLDLQPDPGGRVLAIEIPGERGIGLFFGRRWPRRATPRQYARLEQHLKAVANAQHQLVGSEKAPERIAQSAAELPREDHAGPDVVAVAKSAGDTNDLEVV